MTATKTVWAIDWLEFEEGWGPRPDGHSLHSSLKNAIRYMRKEIQRYTGIHTSDPDSIPYEVTVSVHIYENILKSDGNLKVSSILW